MSFDEHYERAVRHCELLPLLDIDGERQIYPLQWWDAVAVTSQKIGPLEPDWNLRCGLHAEHILASMWCCEPNKPRCSLDWSYLQCDPVASRRRVRSIGPLARADRDTPG